MSYIFKIYFMCNMFFKIWFLLESVISRILWNHYTDYIIIYFKINYFWVDQWRLWIWVIRLLKIEDLGIQLLNNLFIEFIFRYSEQRLFSIKEPYSIQINVITIVNINKNILKYWVRDGAIVSCAGETEWTIHPRKGLLSSLECRA